MDKQITFGILVILAIGTMFLFTSLTGEVVIQEYIPDITIQTLAGSGTVGDPYQITNCTDLNQTRDDLTAYYQLTQDINCSDTVNWDAGAGFTPIGSVSTKFTGTFYGQNYTISDLYMNRPSTDYVGLFGYASTTSLSNVGLIDVNISGQYGVGGLVGRSEGIVTNSYSTGSISGSGWTGGLVGYNYLGTVTNSYSTGNVTGGSDWIGGLVGYGNGAIINSYATGSVFGVARVGGLSGWNDGATITDSYATGNVSGSTEVGGLVGYSSGTITNSSSTGDVNGSSNVGGFVGYNDATITNSYSTGTVSGSSTRVGGLIGWSHTNGFVINSYSTGNVSGTGSIGGLVGYDFGAITNSSSTGNVSGNTEVGGLVGHNIGGTINNSYATGNVSGINNLGGLAGYNDATITNSYSTGTVSGSGNGVGGLVGWNHLNGIVLNSYSTESVSGIGSIGGLVGANYANITNSYSTGNVSGSNFVGGLIGFYSSGSITNSYWNNHTWNPHDCYNGGNGNCTAIADNESYFYDVSNVPLVNWSYPPWSAINDGGDYPILEWQVPEAPEINSTEFTGDTTNFSEVSDFSDITNLVLHNPEHGKIIFTESVDLSAGADLDLHVNISFNRVDINSTALAALNKSARIILYNLTASNPRPLINGVACSTPQCTEVSYSGGTFIFDVASFTTYSSEETPAAAETTNTTVEEDSGIGCPPQFECGEWNDCSPAGTQSRTCSDTLCGFPERTETQACVYIAPAPEPVLINEIVYEETFLQKTLRTLTENANYVIGGLIVLGVIAHAINSLVLRPKVKRRKRK